MQETKQILLLRQCPAGEEFRTVGGRGGAFTVKVRDAGRGVGVEFIRESGTSKSVSAERFMEFWALWASGKRDLDDYRNQSGQRTRAAAASYLLPVFEWIDRQG